MCYTENARVSSAKTLKRFFQDKLIKIDMMNLFVASKENIYAKKISKSNLSEPSENALEK